MKQRFSSLDVKVIAHELSNNITNFRVTNLYDLSTRIFLIKLHAPGKKEHLLIDSGFRCHLTSFVRTTAAAPSPFIQRLRKFLKSRRVTAVSQVGTDRIIEFQFSDGLYRLFLEFYASGNIVLTDGKLKIIALLRDVSEGEAHEQLKLGLQYNLTNRQNYGGVPQLTRERVTDGLKSAMEKIQAQTSKKDKYARSSKDLLRKSLAISLKELPPMLLDHGLATVGWDKDTSAEDVLRNESVMDSLMKALQEASRIVSDVLAASSVKGYILQKPHGSQNIPPASDETVSSSTADSPKLFYEDFHPFKPKQFVDQPSIEFLEIEGYNKTVDEFFSSIEGQRLESRLHEREENARKRLDQARADHEKRITGLQDAQQLQVRKAEAIEANLDRVEEARGAINGLVGQGMDWVDISRLIETEQKRGNAVAQMIKLPLKLYENTATLLLSEPTFDGEKDDEGYETEDVSDDSEDEAEARERNPTATKQEDHRFPVDIDLDLSSWANASQYYDQKRVAVKKEEKTVQSSKKALRSAKDKIEGDLKKALKTEKHVLRVVRKQHWFEKFLFFISSEGYLVLGGRDAPQSDLLYRRYLRKGDIYVHADLQGACSVIIKNNPSYPDAPIPPSTLSQAGNLSVCTSQAWDSKAVMSAWWVHADQVSKTTPTGEFIATGGFMIRGTKNYLPPSQLLLGFAVLFEISEDSKANHAKHRAVNSVSKTSSQNEAEPMLQDRNAAQDSEIAEAGNNKGNISGDEDDDDDEEDFPDVKLEASTPYKGVNENEIIKHDTDNDDDDEEEEEEFPDVKLDRTDDEVEDQEDGDDTAGNYNPLQNISRSQHTENGIEDIETVSHASEEDDADNSALESAARDSRTQSRSNQAQRDFADHEPHSAPQGSEAAQPVIDVVNQAETPTEVSASKSKAYSTDVSKKTQPRGKRGKQKKLAAKYADQDDEDRELAMHLLGSTVGQERAKAQVEAQKKKRAAEEAERQRRREQHLKVQAAAEEKRRKAVDNEAGLALNDDEDEDDYNNTTNDDEATRLSLLKLDSFIGRPLHNDELLAAIPICAPWQALSSYKYRVKLQPGNDKRGKAVKHMLGRWDADSKVTRNVDLKSEDSEKMWPKEIELIRAWKDTEVVGVIPVGKMKVMTTGDSSGTAGGRGKTTSGKANGGKGNKKKR